MIARLTITGILLLQASQAFAIYQCSNDSGGMTFQDTPCASVAAPGKTSSQIIHNNSITSFTEPLLRTIYKEQTDAMSSGDLKWLCEIMDDRFRGNVKMTSTKPVMIRQGKKQEACRDYRALFADLADQNRKWLYKVEITSISISDDQKQAVVKSSYSFTVNQPGASSKGSSSDTWTLKDGHVYLTKVDGEAAAF